MEDTIGAYWCWRGATCFALALLGGCASFSGVPATVIPLRSVVNLATTGKFGLDQAADRIDRSTDGSRAYRDAFIAVQMAAIDARYLQFRSKLSAQSKGANFGLELGVLALTGAGSVVTTSLANVLSAGGAGLTGTKAALSKEVYFERTLPAILDSMDAQRIAARAPIMAGLGKDPADYSLAQAIIDLFAYQNSASLDGAIGRLTVSAAVEKANAEAEYENLTDACHVDAGVSDIWRAIVTALQGLDPGKDEAILDGVSTVFGTATVPPYPDQLDLIRSKLSTYCSKASADTLYAALKANTTMVLP